MTAAELVRDVAECIEDGLGNAVCIPWSVISRDPGRAIAEACSAFEEAGWTWNITRKQLERGGWYAWFRSQGELASPILQWSRMDSLPPEPDVQGSLF